jgi:hypothetical protein
MSQFSCPLCGKNSSIGKYDPDELDLDLKVVTYGSTGRGGIYIADKSSILGQGDPIEQALARRTVKLTKMFIDSGALSREQVTDELGLNKINPISHSPSSTKRTLNFTPLFIESDELEQLRKQSAEESEIKTAFLAISRICKSELHLNEDLELTLKVLTDDNGYELVEFFEPMDKTTREKILKRISSEEPLIQMRLEMIANQPEKKDAFELALETDFEWNIGSNKREKKTQP